MQVEIGKWGEDDVYGIKVIAENPEEQAILDRFFKGGAKANVRGGDFVQFTFADMIRRPEHDRKTRNMLEDVAKLVYRNPEEAVETLSHFREDIREESRDQLIAELSCTLGQWTGSALGSVIEGILEKLVFFPIEPMRATRVAPAPISPAPRVV